MKDDITDHEELRARRTKRFAEMLLQVTNDLAKTKTLDEALETLVNITTSSIGAERGTIFLNDNSTGELYSRVAQGNFRREIRILNTKGVAGWVFSKNEGVIIHDAYELKNKTGAGQRKAPTRCLSCCKTMVTRCGFATTGS